MKRKCRHTLLPAALLCLLAATTAHARNQPGLRATVPATELITQTSLQPEEKMPKFQGGDLKAFVAWISSRIEYPAEALERGAGGGKVLVGFVVERDGTVSNITIDHSTDPALAEIVQRTIASSPRWEPGELSGKPTRTRFQIPFQFQIPDTASEPCAKQITEPPQTQPAQGQPATNPDCTRNTETNPEEQTESDDIVVVAYPIEGQDKQRDTLPEPLS